MKREEWAVYLPCNCKRGQDKTLQETKKPSGISFVEILGKCARFLPESEAKSITQGISAKHGNEGEHNETNDEQDFAQCRPKFTFSVPLNGENIDQPESQTISANIFNTFLKCFNGNISIYSPIQDYDDCDDSPGGYDVTYDKRVKAIFASNTLSG